MELFYHPLSRSCQKVLIALYEKQANFFPRLVNLHDPVERHEYLEMFPLGQLPLLKTREGWQVSDSSIIIEYINQHVTENTQLFPTDSVLNLRTKMLDRLIDNQLYHILYEIERHHRLPEQMQQAILLRQLYKQLDTILTEFDKQVEGHYWLCGDGFTLADCALIPALASLPAEVQLMEYFELNRYWQQAELRGAWHLVKDEIDQAKQALHTGIQPPP